MFFYCNLVSSQSETFGSFMQHDVTDSVSLKGDAELDGDVTFITIIRTNRLTVGPRQHAVTPSDQKG